MMWVQWEDEDGIDLVDGYVLLHELDRVFNREELEQFHCLKFVYSYDDTIFNYLQRADLPKELDVVEGFDLSETQRQDLAGLRKFIAQIKPELQMTALLKFYGE
jgi:hypothetical protein